MTNTSTNEHTVGYMDGCTACREDGGRRDRTTNVLKATLTTEQENRARLKRFATVLKHQAETATAPGYRETRQHPPLYNTDPSSGYLAALPPNTITPTPPRPTHETPLLFYPGDWPERSWRAAAVGVGHGHSQQKP